MKILIGYYDKDGKHIGKKLDTNRRKKFHIAMGTIRKKIAEYPDQSPYKTHDKIVPYSKSYCDKSRILIQIDEYDNGRKSKELIHIPYFYGDEAHKYDFARQICSHIKTNLRRMIDTTGIEKVYLPNDEQFNLEERRH